MTDRTFRTPQFLAGSPEWDHLATWIQRAFFRRVKVVEHVARLVDEWRCERTTCECRVHNVARPQEQLA
jgi:hypothetical protein